MAANNDEQEQTIKQKLLFYITAFFVLLGTFSLFSFLFLVPFVIDPAFTTIFMEFDEEAAMCVTNETIVRQGASNCSWTSCREGCTREIYNCTQIRVNYKRSRVVGNESEWFIERAKLYPNVKGCGYPPMLNCSKFFSMYREVGTNFSCYYSKVDPGLVISNLDMWQVYMNLVYAMAIPIPSFILSVIYLTFAYFIIYNDDEEKAPLKNNAEGMDVEVESVPDDGLPAQPTSGGITPASEAFREDLASFGQHFKVAMADEMSRESLSEGIPNSVSVSW